MGNHHHHHHHGERQDEIVEGKIDYKVDDHKFIEMNKWPIILLDTTGSMNEAVSIGSTMTRAQLVTNCIGEIAQMLTPMDTADAMRPGFQKGCPIITFNGAEGGIFRGWLHPENYLNEMSTIPFHGSTHIADGWTKMLQTYQDSFSEQPQTNWPLLLILILTDGEIQDQKEFEEHLKHVHGRAFVEIAVVGYGEDHDKALEHYRHITRHHSHVRCTPFTRETDPKVIALQLVSLIDPNVRV